MLSKEETEERVGFKIPQDYWKFQPWGNRLLVRRKPKEEVTKGGLIIPNSSQTVQSVGVIVKVGHTVGDIEDAAGTPGQVIVHDDFVVGREFDADNLVGTEITFGMWSGQALSDGGSGDNEYDGDWILLQALDILGHNLK